MWTDLMSAAQGIEERQKSTRWIPREMLLHKLNDRACVVETAKVCYAISVDSSSRMDYLYIPAHSRIKKSCKDVNKNAAKREWSAWHNSCLDVTLLSVRVLMWKIPR